MFGTDYKIKINNKVEITSTKYPCLFDTIIDAISAAERDAATIQNALDLLKRFTTAELPNATFGYKIDGALKDNKIAFISNASIASNNTNIDASLFGSLTDSWNNSHNIYELIGNVFAPPMQQQTARKSTHTGNGLIEGFLQYCFSNASEDIAKALCAFLNNRDVTSAALSKQIIETHIFFNRHKKQVAHTKKREELLVDQLILSTEYTSLGWHSHQMPIYSEAELKKSLNTFYQSIINYSPSVTLENEQLPILSGVIASIIGSQDSASDMDVGAFYTQFPSDPITKYGSTFGSFTDGEKGKLILAINYVRTEQKPYAFTLCNNRHFASLVIYPEDTDEVSFLFFDGMDTLKNSYAKTWVTGAHKFAKEYAKSTNLQEVVLQDCHRTLQHDNNCGLTVAAFIATVWLKHQVLALEKKSESKVKFHSLEIQQEMPDLSTEDACVKMMERVEKTHNENKHGALTEPKPKPKPLQPTETPTPPASDPKGLRHVINDLSLICCLGINGHTVLMNVTSPNPVFEVSVLHGAVGLAMSIGLNMVAQRVAQDTKDSEAGKATLWYVGAISGISLLAMQASVLSKHMPSHIMSSNDVIKTYMLTIAGQLIADKLTAYIDDNSGSQTKGSITV